MAVRFLKDVREGKVGDVRRDMKPDEEKLFVSVGICEYYTDSPPAPVPATTEDPGRYQRRDMRAEESPPKPKAKRPPSRKKVEKVVDQST